MIGWLMPSVLAVCLILAGILNLLGRYKSPPPQPLVAEKSSSQIASLGQVVTPTATASTPAKQATPLSLQGTVSLHTFEIPVGNFQEVDRVRIEVREIHKRMSTYARQEEYGAVLFVNTGGGLIWGGEKVTKVSTNCYYLPLDSIDNLKEPYSVYFWVFSDQHSPFFSFFTVYLEHINPVSGVVTMKAWEVKT